MINKIWFELTDENSTTTMYTELFTGLLIFGGIVAWGIAFVAAIANDLH